MNLNIRNIDPKARGLLYQLQAEEDLPNLAETIKYVVENYYQEKADTTKKERENE